MHIVNPNDENLEKLQTIKKGKEITERLLSEYEKDSDRFDNDLIGLEAMKWYFRYFFFERKGEMAYAISHQEIGRDDTLLNLLSENFNATSEFCRSQRLAPKIFLRQSFMAAAKAFKAIDAPTRGIIVPYGEEGKMLINNLCSAYDVEKQFSLLRQAQQYTVNVFPNILKALQDSGAVHPIQRDVDVLYLQTEHYDTDFGLSETPIGKMETYCD